MSEEYSSKLKKIIAVSPQPSDTMLAAIREGIESKALVNRWDTIRIPLPKQEEIKKRDLPIMIEPSNESIRSGIMYHTTFAIPKFPVPLLTLSDAEAENMLETKQILDARAHISLMCAMNFYVTVEELRVMYRKGVKMKKIHLKYFTLNQLVRWWLSKFPEDANLDLDSIIYNSTQGFVQNEKGMYFFPMRKV